MSPARRGITLPQPPWGRGPAADLIPFLLLQCVARDSLANPACGPDRGSGRDKSGKISQAYAQQARITQTRQASRSWSQYGVHPVVEQATHRRCMLTGCWFKTARQIQVPIALWRSAP